MHVEHFEDGDTYVTFGSRQEYWGFIEVAKMERSVFCRIYDDGEFHFADAFPQTAEAYYAKKREDVTMIEYHTYEAALEDRRVLSARGWRLGSIDVIPEGLAENEWARYRVEIISIPTRGGQE